MIKVETLEFKGSVYIKHSSDVYMIIQEQTGFEYASAIDVYPCRYTYRESTKLKPKLCMPEPLEAEHYLPVL